MRKSPPRGQSPADENLDLVAAVVRGWATVGEALDRFGYAYDQPTPGDFRFYLATGPDLKKWRAQILVERGVIRLTVFASDKEYRATRQYFVRDLAERLNYQIAVFGYFAFDWATGSTELRQALDIRHERFTAERFEAFLNTLAFPLSIWDRAYAYVDNLKTTAADAMAISLIYHGIAPLQITPATKKRIFNVIEGRGAGNGNSEPPNLTLR